MQIFLYLNLLFFKLLRKILQYRISFPIDLHKKLMYNCKHSLHNTTEKTKSYKMEKISYQIMKKLLAFL